MRRSREKWSESAILKILSPVRLPFRHTGGPEFVKSSEAVRKYRSEPPGRKSAICALNQLSYVNPKDGTYTGKHDVIETTAFHRLELRNALSLALFRQQLTLREIHEAWQEVENDFAAGLLVEREVFWEHVLVEGERSALNHTPVVGCRTLDILHVATAKLIGTTEFCTFDTRQSSLAGRIGFVAVYL